MDSYLTPKNSISFETLIQATKLVEYCGYDELTLRRMHLKSHWYSAPGIDFYYYVTSSGNILKFQMNLLGDAVEWTQSRSLKTGFYFYTDGQGGEISKEEIRFDSQLNETSLARCKEVFEKISMNNLEHKSQILSFFDEPRRPRGLLGRLKSFCSAFFTKSSV